MALPMAFRPVREKTSVMRSRYLFEIYMREGNQQMKDAQYKRAVESFDAALQLNPSSIVAYVAKSKCHQRLGLLKQAMADTEMALAIDNIFPPAVLQKADLFYSLANYEMALLFYHRGFKVDPCEAAFTDGIANCQRHISDTRKRKTMKLTAAGDLTIYVHKKMTRGRDRLHDPLSEGPPRRGSSAGRVKKKKFLNPFVRLGRKQPIKLTIPLRTTNQKADNKRRSVSRSSGGTVFSEPDEKTLKELLGELYGDRMYLSDVYRETEYVESRLGAEVHSLAESGLRFLLDRVTYWNYRRLPPAPTPSPPLSSKPSRQGSSSKRKFNESPLPRQKSSLWEREVSDLLRLLNTGEPKEESVVEEHIIEGYRPYKKEKKKVKKLYFEFATYRPGSDFDERGRAGEDSSGRKSDTRESEDEHMEGEDYILNYLRKELSSIEKAFEDEDFQECKALAVSCLQTVYSYDEAELADKLDLVAKVHSFLGNVHIELEDLSEALQHHEKDLDIGEKCNLKESVSRSLGNLGRVFIRMKLIHKALGAFARKTKLVDRAEEKAWLFHEIGDCFLSLNQYGYARAAGRKSLEAAEENQHRMYQLQACVLIGVAQVKLLEYNAAYEEFERALDLAKTEGDTESEDMIARALQEVNGLITERTRKRREQAQEAKQEDRVSEGEELSDTDESEQHTTSREDNERSPSNDSQPKQHIEKELETVREESTVSDTHLKSDIAPHDTKEDNNLYSSHGHPTQSGEDELVTATKESSEEDTEISAKSLTPSSFGEHPGHDSRYVHPDRDRDTASDEVEDDQKTTVELETQSPREQPKAHIQPDTHIYTQEPLSQSNTRSVSESETSSVRDKSSETPIPSENQTLSSRPGSTETHPTPPHSETPTERRSATPTEPQRNNHPETPNNSGHSSPLLNEATGLQTSDTLQEDASRDILHQSDQNSTVDHDNDGDSCLIEGSKQENNLYSSVDANASAPSEEDKPGNKESAAQPTLQDRNMWSPRGSERSRSSLEHTRPLEVHPQ